MQKVEVLQQYPGIPQIFTTILAEVQPAAAAETSVHGHHAAVLDVAGCSAAVDGQAAAVDYQAAAVDGQAATVLIVVGHSAAFGIAEEKDGIVTHLPRWQRD